METAIENTTVTKRTMNGCSYFDGTGAYQKEMDEIWNGSVPLTGQAKTLHGELVRAVGRLVHEYYNNGNCNACVVNYRTEETPCTTCNGTGTVTGVDDDGEETETDCPDCCGCGYWSEEVEDGCEMSEYYEKFLTLIDEQVPGITREVEQVRDFICTNPDIYDNLFSESNQAYYNRLVDAVMEYVTASEDRELPGWYVGKED